MSSCYPCSSTPPITVPTPPAFPEATPPSPPACSAVWGSITGTPTAQLDLVAYVSARLFGFLTDPHGEFPESTALGVDALSSSTVEGGSTAVGFEALRDETTGAANVAIGHNAMSIATTAGENTIVGNGAGASLTTGLANTAIGEFAGPASGALNNTLALGANANPTVSNQTVIGNSSTLETIIRGGLTLDKTITAIGTTGARTINKMSGSVVFAGGAASLVVTNSLAIAPTTGAVGSIIVAQIRTNDATAVLGAVVCAADGSFTIHMKTNPTGATRVDFFLSN